MRRWFSSKTGQIPLVVTWKNWGLEEWTPEQHRLLPECHGDDDDLGKTNDNEEYSLTIIVAHYRRVNTVLALCPVGRGVYFEINRAVAGFTHRGKDDSLAVGPHRRSGEDSEESSNKYTREWWLINQNWQANSKRRCEEKRKRRGREGRNGIGPSHGNMRYLYRSGSGVVLVWCGKRQEVTVTVAMPVATAAALHSISSFLASSVVMTHGRPVDIDHLADK
ncbi:hypothetical protein F5888DRAFT_1890416 [Russula emetica]|nr:hypothetical protein F5888DRAFT_1890416 [Russula emetica]